MQGQRDPYAPDLPHSQAERVDVAAAPRSPQPGADAVAEEIKAPLDQAALEAAARYESYLQKFAIYCVRMGESSTVSNSSSSNGEQQSYQRGDVLASNLLWDHNCGLSLYKRKLIDQKERDPAQFTTPEPHSVRSHAPFSAAPNPVQPTTFKKGPSQDVLEATNWTSLAFIKATVGLPDSAKQRIIDLILDSKFKPAELARNTYILELVEDLLLVKLRSKSEVLPQKQKKNGEERDDVAVHYFDILDLLSRLDCRLDCGVVKFDINGIRKLAQTA